MDFNESDEIIETKVESIMRDFTSLLGGCHVECDADGLITSMSVTADNKSDSWEVAVGETIDDFLDGIKYVNAEGEEVEFDIENYTEDDFLECVKYLMGPEVARRTDLLHVSRDEYLAALLSEDVKTSVAVMLRDKAEDGKEIEYEDSLYAALEWEDVARKATPAFREKYIDNLSLQISGTIELLEECSEDEIAGLNIAKLEELAEKIENATPEEILPEESFEDFYIRMRDYQTDYSYAELVDMDAVYDSLVAECQQYTYTLPEVAVTVFENSETDSYTVEADKAKLHEIVEAHPMQISKDGIPYEDYEIDLLVEKANAIGWDAVASDEKGSTK